MLARSRRRTEDEHGFTLIEILVVILIIGVLAAIAIPAFINQKGKGNDAAAKSQARSAQTAAETLAADHGGDYSSTTLAGLQTIEVTLSDSSQATLQPPTGVSTNGYSVSSRSNTTGDTFSITRAGGVVTRTCANGAGSSTSGCIGGVW